MTLITRSTLFLPKLGKLMRTLCALLTCRILRTVVYIRSCLSSRHRTSAELLRSMSMTSPWTFLAQARRQHPRRHRARRRLRHVLMETRRRIRVLKPAPETVSRSPIQTGSRRRTTLFRRFAVQQYAAMAAMVKPCRERATTGLGLADQRAPKMEICDRKSLFHRELLHSSAIT